MSNTKADTSIKNVPQKIGSLLDTYKLEDKGGYITQEFQDYAYRLALELQDDKRVSLYMRLAKTVDRGILEQARRFVKDANARTPSRLFMWKVKQIRDAAKQTDSKPINNK